MQKIFRSQLELLQQNIVRSLNLQIQPKSIWKTSNALEIYYILVFLKPRHHSHWQPLEGLVAIHPICSLCSPGFETTLETSLAIVAAEVDFTGENLCRDRASQQLQDALMAMLTVKSLFGLSSTMIAQQLSRMITVQCR